MRQTYKLSEHKITITFEIPVAQLKTEGFQPVLNRMGEFVKWVLTEKVLPKLKL